LQQKKNFSLRASAPFLLAALVGFPQNLPAQSSLPQCAPVDHYKIVPLPLRPVHINRSGVIVGITEDHQAAIWTEKDGLREIELPEGFESAQPLGIDSNGSVVGAASNKSGQTSAFLYEHGAFSILSQELSKASVIDDAGDIAGEYKNRLVFWRNKKLVPFGDCCGGTVRGINKAGHVVGHLNDKNGGYGAFWGDASGQHSIAVPGARNSTAISINDNDHILVQAFVPNGAFLQTGGKNQALQFDAEYASQPLGLNNCDVIVGEFGAASDFNHAFIWTAHGGFRDLNKLADVGSEWILESALDINDRGEIVGFGDRGNEEDVGFLLIPESKPPSVKPSAQSPR
jgi:probable HAF family extracellular repeat protein